MHRSDFWVWQPFLTLWSILNFWRVRPISNAILKSIDEIYFNLSTAAALCLAKPVFVWLTHVRHSWLCKEDGGLSAKSSFRARAFTHRCKMNIYLLWFRKHKELLEQTQTVHHLMNLDCQQRANQMLKTMVTQLTRIIKRRENQSPRMVKGSRRRRAGTGTGKNCAIW